MFGTSAFAAAPFASLADGQVVSVALTGNAASGAVGTVAVSSSVALTGVVSNGTAGTVSVSCSVGITGDTATGNVGSRSGEHTSELQSH